MTIKDLQPAAIWNYFYDITQIPADDRFVYIKEFMVKRVDTFFFRLVRADTYFLVFFRTSISCEDIFSQFFSKLRSSLSFNTKAHLLKGFVIYIYS